MGGDYELCTREQEQLWSTSGSDTAVKMTKERKLGIEYRCVCYPIRGTVLIAETANPDKKISLGEALIVSKYAHGLVGLRLLSLWAFCE